MEPRRHCDVLFIVTDRVSTCFVTPIAAALAENGLRSGLIANFGGRPPDATEVAVFARIISVPMRRNPSPIVDLLHLFALVRNIIRLRPTMVHVSTPKAGLLGALAARVSRVPVVVYQVRGFRAERSRGLGRRILVRAEKTSMRAAHHVIYESPSLRRELAEGIGAPPGVVVGEGSSIGVDTTRFILGPARSGARTLGFVGRIHTDKGVEDLLQVFARVRHRMPTVGLIVVGAADPTDPDSSRLETLLRETEGVELVGEVRDVVPQLQKMDVLMMPSVREGLPNVPLEAQSCGVPVVGYASTGMIDAVTDGTGGILVPVGDVEGLADASLRLLLDESLRRELGANGRLDMIERFDSKRVIAGHVTLLSGLLSGASCTSSLAGSRAG